MDLSTREQSYDIALSNCQDCQVVDEKVLDQVARRCLAQEGVVEAAVSIAFVDNARIRRLNRDYLSHDYATDVLSFLLDMEYADRSVAAAAPQEGVNRAGIDGVPTQVQPRGAGKRVDGEVILSVEMATQSAARFGWSPQDELTLYLVHGLLHLCGYDDETAAERKNMRARECQVLAPWGLKPNYDAPPRDGELAKQPVSTKAGANR